MLPPTLSETKLALLLKGPRKVWGSLLRPLEMEQQQQQILSENSLSDEDYIEDIVENNMGQNLVYAGICWYILHLITF